MAKPTQLYPRRQPRRPHYIKEWAERRGMSQADIARELGADKSIVSRWFNGTTPGIEWQAKIAALLSRTGEAEEIETDAIFRHPDDDWIARFMRGRSEAEVERIKRTLESAFPRTGTNDN